MLATLSQRYDKKSFHLKNERLTEISQAVRFIIVLIPYIILLNLSDKMYIFEEHDASKVIINIWKYLTKKKT